MKINILYNNFIVEMKKILEDTSVFLKKEMKNNTDIFSDKTNEIITVIKKNNAEYKYELQKSKEESNKNFEGASVFLKEEMKNNIAIFSIKTSEILTIINKNNNQYMHHLQNSKEETEKSLISMQEKSNINFENQRTIQLTMKQEICANGELINNISKTLSNVNKRIVDQYNDLVEKYNLQKIVSEDNKKANNQVFLILTITGFVNFIGTAALIIKIFFK